MKRRPGRLICPACKHEADNQPSYQEGNRIFQSFICDDPNCPVSSFNVEWRTHEQ